LGLDAYAGAGIAVNRNLRRRDYLRCQPRRRHVCQPAMSWTLLAEPENWVAFLTLLSLEIVLGVDNIIFISILAGSCRRAAATGAPDRPRRSR
jgi:hypothetical protein